MILVLQPLADLPGLLTVSSPIVELPQLLCYHPQISALNNMNELGHMHNHI